MRAGRDAGAAVVEFVMMALLLLLLLSAVLEVAVYFYARNVVAAAAADAARYAAAEGMPAGSGRERATSLIRAGLDAADAAHLHCTDRTGRDADSGLPVTIVHCSGRLRLLFSPLSGPLAIDVTSAALREQAP